MILVGHLGSDPEYRQSANGVGVTRCSIATNKIWKDSNGEEQRRTDWHKVVFFNRLADIASQYLKKGSQLYVEGELRTNSWEKDGVKRYSTDIIAQEMQMLGGRGGDDSAPSYEDEYPEAQAGNTGNAPRSERSEQSARGEQKTGGGQKSAGSADHAENPDDDIPF